MMAVGLMEVLILLFVSGGAASTDLAGVLPAQTYFKSRSIEINVDKAVELAGHDPVDGKTQIAQLVALRYLEEETAKLKSSPNYQAHLQLLTAIAAGTRSQDPQGFAKEYAGRVLTRHGGKSAAAAAPG